MILLYQCWLPAVSDVRDVEAEAQRRLLLPRTLVVATEVPTMIRHTIAHKAAVRLGFTRIMQGWNHWDRWHILAYYVISWLEFSLRRVCGRMVCISIKAILLVVPCRTGKGRRMGIMTIPQTRLLGPWGERAYLMWLPINSSFLMLELFQLSIWLHSHLFSHYTLFPLVPYSVLILMLSSLQTHQIFSCHMNILHIQLVLEIQHLLC